MSRENNSKKIISIQDSWKVRNRIHQSSLPFVSTQNVHDLMNYFCSILITLISLLMEQCLDNGRAITETFFTEKIIKMFPS